MLIFTILIYRNYKSDKEDSLYQTLHRKYNSQNVMLPSRPLCQ